MQTYRVGPERSISLAFPFSRTVDQILEAASAEETHPVEAPYVLPLGRERALRAMNAVPPIAVASLNKPSAPRSTRLRRITLDEFLRSP